MNTSFHDNFDDATFIMEIKVQSKTEFFHKFTLLPRPKTNYEFLKTRNIYLALGL